MKKIALVLTALLAGCASMSESELALQNADALCKKTYQDNGQYSVCLDEAGTKIAQDLALKGDRSALEKDKFSEFVAMHPRYACIFLKYEGNQQEYENCMATANNLSAAWQQKKEQDHRENRRAMANAWSNGWNNVAAGYRQQAVINQINANQPMPSFEQPQQHSYVVYPRQGGGYIINGQ